MRDVIDERKEEIARSMTRAGIGSVYHAVTLSSFGAPGEHVKALINEPGFKSSVLAGRGFTVATTKAEDGAFPFVLARAMRLSRIDVRVTRLLPLLKFLEQDKEDDIDDRFRDFARAEALMIPGFFDVLDEKPFTRRELYRIEDYLTDLMDNGFSVSVQCFGNLSKQSWFTARFISQLKARNTEVIV